MELESKEIIKIEDVPAIADDKLVLIAEQAEKRIEAVNKIKRIALRVTNKYDWTDQGGKPYLQVSGAEKIARLFGVSWRIGEPIKESMEDGHFSFTFKGEFSLSGTTIEAIGIRSSKDGFFKKYNYSTGKGIELPPSEIDSGDVKKSAYTNLLGNGIMRLLGLRNLTYEDLVGGGINKDEIGKVDYKKSGKGKEGISSEGSQVTIFIPTGVNKKDGTAKNGKAYTLYTVKNGEVAYTTFSESFATAAKEAMSAKKQITITFVDSGKGLNIENLRTVIEDEPQSSTPENNKLPF